MGECASHALITSAVYPDVCLPTFPEALLPHLPVCWVVLQNMDKVPTFPSVNILGQPTKKLLKDTDLKTLLPNEQLFLPQDTKLSTAELHFRSCAQCSELCWIPSPRHLVPLHDGLTRLPCTYLSPNHI